MTSSLNTRMQTICESMNELAYSEFDGSVEWEEIAGEKDSFKIYLLGEEADLQATCEVRGEVGLQNEKTLQTHWFLRVVPLDTNEEILLPAIPRVLLSVLSY